MFNGLVVVNVRPFVNGSADKNGLEPKILNVLAGKSPNRTVISGTIADSLGLEDNKAYLMQVRETEESPVYGRQFNFSVVSSLSGMEIIQTCKELGAAVVFDIDATDEKPVIALATKAKATPALEEVEA